jgi:preprotein translocase subunit Sss1
MPIITDSAERKPIWQRLLWFVALWAGSVAALGVVGYAIKLVLKP